MGKRWALFYLIFAITLSVAQNIDSPPKVTYFHGTCVIVAWHAENIAVAADSRNLDVRGNILFPATRTSSIGSDQCKLRQPSSRVLLTIEGLSSIRNGSVDLWDGLDVANDIFKTSDTYQPSTIELLSKASLWQDSFQTYIDNGMVHPEALSEGTIVYLHVVDHIDNEPVVVSAGFTMNGGRIVRIPPYIVPAPANNITKVIKYGSCNLHLGENRSRSDLSGTEKNRYITLSKKQPAAISESQLRELAADYVHLASKISARLATNEEPADVAPPFTITSFDLRLDQWTTHTFGACTDYLTTKLQLGQKGTQLRSAQTK